MLSETVIQNAHIMHIVSQDTDTTTTANRPNLKQSVLKLLCYAVWDKISSVTM